MGLYLQLLILIFTSLGMVAHAHAQDLSDCLSKNVHARVAPSARIAGEDIFGDRTVLLQGAREGQYGGKRYQLYIDSNKTGSGSEIPWSLGENVRDTLVAKARNDIIAISGDPRGAMIALGEPVSRFLGFEDLGNGSYIVPDRIEISEGLKKLNARLRRLEFEPLPVHFSETEGKLSNEGLLSALHRRKAWPMADPIGREGWFYFFHDVSFHLPVLLFPPEMSRVVDLVLSMEVGFKEYVENHHPDLFKTVEAQRFFREETDRLAQKMDELYGYGSRLVASKHDGISVAIQVAIAPDFERIVRYIEKAKLLLRLTAPGSPGESMGRMLDLKGAYLRQNAQLFKLDQVTPVVNEQTIETQMKKREQEILQAVSAPD